MGVGARTPRRQPDPAAARDGTPSTTTASSSGDIERSAAGPHHGAGSGCASWSADRAQGAHRAVQAREHLLGKGVDPVHDRLRPRVGGPRLALLLIGEGQRAEREDLVDLARVEQVTGAFRRDAGVVVHDDRGRQHHVPLARGARQHRERVQVAALLRGLRRPLGRLQQRQELPVLHRQHAMGGDEGAAQHLGARRVDRLVGHRVLDEHTQPAQRERRRGVRDRQPQPCRQRPPRTHDAAPDSAAVSPNGSISSPPGRVTSSTCSRSPSSASATATSNSLGTASSKVRWCSPPISSSSTSTNSPSAALRCTERRCGWRNRSRTRSRARRLRLEQALGALSPRVRRARNRLLDRWTCLDPLARGEHPELPANPVLRRRLPIRVEQVALVEHRVRHRACRLPALDVGRLTTRRPSIAIDHALPISSD